MVERLIFMEGVELARKILLGERNFSRIELEEGFNLCGWEGFNELQKYLKEADLEKNPVNFENSQLRYLDADGLYLPFLQAKGANFKHVALTDAYLKNAQLENTDLRYARLCATNLDKANLGGADFRLADLNLASLKEAILVGTDFKGADLEYTNMQRADLRGVKNLQWARFLKTVNFQFAEITDVEKNIIRQALWEEESKKRRLFGGSG